MEMKSSILPELWKSLREKLKESLISVVPVSILVFLLSITPWVDISQRELVVFACAAILLIVGIGLFNLGADMAMTPMGQYIGEGLTKSRKLGILLSVSLMMGILITVAEPDLAVLAGQVNAVMNGTLLVVTVGVGVGLFLLAHLGYVAYCLCRGRLRWGWLVALCLVFGAGYYGVLLRPHIGDAVTSVAVLAYVLVSCLSMAAALGLKKESEFSEYSEYSEKPDGASLSHILFAVGIASLLFSDLLIAQKRFLGDDTLYALMMPTYFASQLLVTASILHNTRRK